jgi:hypothetical protein
LGERESWVDNRISPSVLLVSGLLLAPTIVLQQNLFVKAVQAVLFLGLAQISVVSGRRRLLIGSLIFIITTILVNLLSPVGKVVLLVGPLRITRGALQVGITKALTLSSLLYVSRICVRPSLRLPGAAGRTISQTFAYLGKLLARRKRVSRRNVVQSLDEQFESILQSSDGELTGAPIQGNSVIGVVAIVALLIANWGALFFPFSALLAGL